MVSGSWEMTSPLIEMVGPISDIANDAPSTAYDWQKAFPWRVRAYQKRMTIDQGCGPKRRTEDGVRLRNGVRCVPVTLHSGRLVFEDIEQRQHAHGGQQTLIPGGQVGQPDVAALSSNCLELGDQHAHTRAVDMGDTLQVQDKLGPSLRQQLLDRCAKRHLTVVEQ